MEDQFIIPAETSIGHVHLKVSNLKTSLDFYHKLLGFEIVRQIGDQVAFISAGGYHHHIGLNTWYSKDSEPNPQRAPGLFHTAILMPTRKDLAIIYQRLMSQNYPLTGAADHGVSEAIYLDDPDKNGVEIYWDRPKEGWPLKENGSLDMYTRRLDIQGLLNEL